MKVQYADAKARLLDIAQNLPIPYSPEYRKATYEKAIELQQYLEQFSYHPRIDSFSEEIAGVVNEPYMIRILFLFYKHNARNNELSPYKIHIQAILSISAELDNVATIKFLLEIGANINDDNLVGERPLHHAVYRQHESAIKYLLNRSAEINIQDKNGITPLFSLIASNKYPKPEIVQFLIDKDADPRIPSDFGNIFENAVTKDPQIIKILSDASERLNARDALGAVDSDE